MSNQPTIFEGVRLSLAESIDITVESLRAYGARHDVWSVAFSGGKDSTTLVTLIVHLIETGRIPKPRKMYVLYGDTRMELLPLWLSATSIMVELSKRDWIECRTVMAELDQRFFVYMLGRGVPPPNNNTLRWCTAQIKVEPMEAELRRLAAEVSNVTDTTGGADLPGLQVPEVRRDVPGLAGHLSRTDSLPDLSAGREGSSPQRAEAVQAKSLALKPLMLIGVRIGESAARDARIALACSRNGAECGQGWYQQDLPDAVCDKLSPILHWRACLVWDWLMGMDRHARHGFNTRLLAVAYGQDADGSHIELSARTGCVGCPLATEDLALEGLLKHYPKEWGYLAPLRGLRPIYRELREPRNRLRQPPGETRKDGTLISNQNRMGPLTMLARKWAFDQIVGIQRAINWEAERLSRPLVDIFNIEEQVRVVELWECNTWPNGWDGTEPIADELYEDQYQDGSRQLLLPTIRGGGA